MLKTIKNIYDTCNDVAECNLIMWLFVISPTIWPWGVEGSNVFFFN